MLNKLLDSLKNIDKNTLKLINKGVTFSFFICITATLLLISYTTYFQVPSLYYISLSLFKTGLMYAVSSFICGFSIDIIKKQMI